MAGAKQGGPEADQRQKSAVRRWQASGLSHVVSQEEPALCPVTRAEKCDEGMKIIVLKLPAGTEASIIREVVEAVISTC